MNKDFADIIGKRFGKLLVLSKTSKRTLGGNIYWECLCDCGNIRLVTTSNLNRGHVTSCGCTRKFSKGKASFNQIFRTYKKSAKTKNLIFSLTEEEFTKLLNGNCYYCGCGPSGVIKSKYGTGDFEYNGIDRIDSSIGYISTNVVSCCKTCNYAKRNMSLQDFYKWVKNIYKNLHDNKII